MQTRRFHLLATMSLISCTVGTSSEPVTTPDSGPDSSLGGIALQQSGGSWWNQVQPRLATELRAIRPGLEANTFEAHLPMPALSALFDASGARVTAPSTAGELSLRLSSWGREGAEAELMPVVPALGAPISGSGVGSLDGLQPLEYAHPGVTEWWVAASDGVEQGFTLDVRPAGAGLLAFGVEIKGTLDIEINAEQADAAWITDEQGHLWSYGRLSAWDATGEPLLAWMEVDGETVRILVDDTGAVYPIIVDPIVSTADSTITGTTSGEELGLDVASAGDVNGDGYDDVLVGSYKYASNVGRVYVHYGSASGISATAATTLSGSGTEYFGWSLSGIGDVNSDGYDDIAVTAPYSSGGGVASAGAVYVYHGSSSGVVSPAAVTYRGTVIADLLAYSVAGAGDVNNDGYDDIVIGGPYLDGSVSNAGKALIAHGSASGLSATPNTEIVGTASSERLGFTVASAGDVNGDDYDDIVIGSPFVSSSAGNVRVYHGSATGVNTTAATTLSGSAASDNYGYAVDGAGDLNGDGYDDVVVGAYQVDYGGNNNAGAAMVYMGSASGLSTSAAWSVYGVGPDDQLGRSVAGLGDVNSDGYSDVAIAAHQGDNASVSNTGVVAVYEGSATGLATTAVTTLYGESTDNYLGYVVADAGDVNADGLSDLIASATGADTSITNVGKVYVHIGFVDADGDGYGVLDDCDDTRSDVSPGATEVCDADNVDEDCDGLSDNDDDSTDDTDFALFYQDADGDSYGNAAVSTRACDQPAGYVDEASDCDDTDVSIGQIDVYYGDGDGDGYGDSDDVLESCDPVDGYVLVGEDCNDSNASIGAAPTYYQDDDDDGYGNPDASTTSCDGAPDGFVTDSSDCDDTDASIYGNATYYADADGDGFGDPAVETDACSQPSGYVLDNTDCDDTASSAFPGGIEVCDENNIDEDCNGTADDDDSGVDEATFITWYADDDNDSYGDSADSTTSCDAPSGYVDNGLDCDDTDASQGALLTWYDDDDSDGLGDPDDLVSTCSSPSGYVLNSSDCDDTSASVGAATDWYADSDGDSFGDESVGMDACDQPTGYVADATDCNDSRADVNVLADEVCDASNVDEDCDGLVDDADADPSGTANFYPDTDGDGLGDSVVAFTACDGAIGYVNNNSDCDDTSADVGRPGTWYLDADTDSYGDPDMSTDACDQPSGYVNNDEDCDDSDATISPSGTEIGGDGIDQDCSGLDLPVDRDEDGVDSNNDCDDYDATVGYAKDWYADSDGDSYGDADMMMTACDQPTGYIEDDTDCDDSDAMTYPGASEVLEDGIDQDCDGADLIIDTDGDGVGSTTDCDDTDSSVGGPDTWYMDGDGDGYGDPAVTMAACEKPAGYVSDATDCDDSDASINLDGVEVYDDGIDQDCDGADATHDVDGDGIFDDTDCDDTDASVGGPSAWYMDSDSDGFGDATMVMDACDQPTGYVMDSTDCDDTNSSIFPDATETYSDGIDQDCDGVDNTGDNDGDGVDSATDCDDTDASVGGPSTWYADADADSFGDASVSMAACDQPDGYVTDATDCNDADGTIYPGATTVVGDGIDQDCDGLDETGDDDGDGVDGSVDCDDNDPSVGAPGTYYADTDADNYGDPATMLSSCEQPSGYITDGTDCDDTSASVYPGAPVVYSDGIDQDCDGVDESGDNDGDGVDSSVDCDDNDASVGTATTWYKDADSDGYGLASSTTTACDQPAGYAAVDGDCDDTSIGVNPGVSESWYDGIDQNCDGNDRDQDGDGEDADTVGGSDCNDTDAATNSTAAEVWYDGVDQNCDGNDADQDGDGDDVDTMGGSDCDDTDASVNTSATEVWYDGTDQDCDGNDDDQDGDGYSNDTDCDDTDPAFYPGVDGYDDNCQPLGGGDTGVGGGDDTGKGDGGGCGCATNPAPSGLAAWFGGLLVMLGLRRRK